VLTFKLSIQRYIKILVKRIKNKDIPSTPKRRAKGNEGTMYTEYVNWKPPIVGLKAYHNKTDKIKDNPVEYKAKT
jgi:hypothetical protein